MKKIEELTIEELPELVKEGRTVLFFTASWCSDCKFLKPFMPAVESDFANIKFVEVDTDASMDLAQELNIFGIPSMVVFQDGKEAGRLVNKDRKTKQEVEDFLNSVA